MDSVESTQEQRDGDVLLELRDVTYAYDAGRDVVRQVSLSIGAGETIALLGGNGAGKSTYPVLLPGSSNLELGKCGYGVNPSIIGRSAVEVRKLDM